jgi:histidyl-tRNA synthetase
MYDPIRKLSRLHMQFQRALASGSRIIELLDVLDCEYQIDISSGRGFEYYTGTIFQFITDDEIKNWWWLSLCP